MTQFVRFKLDLHYQLMLCRFLGFIYSFILVTVVCSFSMILYLISVRSGVSFIT